MSSSSSSIGSVNSIAGTSRIAAQVPDSPHGAATARTGSSSSPAAGSSDATPSLGAEMKQPTPPHFPWLSRLSAQLEPLAVQKSPFPSAPLIGDNVNQAA